MEEEVLVGTQESGCGGNCCSDFVHDNLIIESFYLVEVHARIWMQMAQHGTVDVHAIVPEDVIRFVVSINVQATRKQDECRYQKELKECRLFHQGGCVGHEMGKKHWVFKYSPPTGKPISI